MNVEIRKNPAAVLCWMEAAVREAHSVGAASAQDASSGRTLDFALRACTCIDRGLYGPCIALTTAGG